jgi:SAM-dependent methyltransferase
MNVFYRELAPWWPLLSPVEEYEAEGAAFVAALHARRPRARDLLELGAGGGHVAYHLKGRFDCTLTDLSPEMVAVSRARNPECAHAVGDMRELDLGRTFDVVFVHDAIDYLRTEADLAAAFATAFRNLAPGGLALFVPDHVSERFGPGTEAGGSDAPDGRGARWLEWTEDAEPTASSAVTHYSFVLREADGAVHTRYERHEFGLFPEATWVRLLEATGFEVEVEEEPTDDEDQVPRLLFFGHRPATPAGA